MAHARTVSPLARLVQTLREEGIRFQIAGMSAAILQGVPATTLDTDIWVELPYFSPRATFGIAASS